MGRKTDCGRVTEAGNRGSQEDGGKVYPSGAKAKIGADLGHIPQEPRRNDLDLRLHGGQRPALQAYPHFRDHPSSNPAHHSRGGNPITVG